MTEASPCPSCNNRSLTYVPAKAGSIRAVPGDIVVCRFCGSALKITETGEPRLLTGDEEIDMDDKFREELSAVQWAGRNHTSKTRGFKR